MRPAAEIHVTCAAVFDAAGRILVTRRPADADQGGLWEFPGGKLEPGESPCAGLERELAEELGIAVREARPLIRVRHDYADRRVLLDCWRVEAFRGIPRGLEGQPLRWVPADELAGLALPAADRPIVNALRLPDAYLVTPEPPAKSGIEVFLQRLDRALARGIELIQLRAKALDRGRLAELAAAIQRRCDRHGARLLINESWELAQELGLGGVHLTAAQLAELHERPLSRDQWVAASCHNAAELARAAELGVDFAVLGPVAATASHPGASPLGWSQFAGLCDAVNLPVFAIGGMRYEHRAEVWRRGGQGIASMSALWSELTSDPDY